MPRFLSIAIVIIFTAPVLAQGTAGIRWQNDPEQAVAQAKNTKLPLMCYVLSGEKDRDEKVHSKQNRAFADPRVVKLSERFVCLKLSRSGHRDKLAQFHLSPAANMEISFVAPADGSQLGDIGPTGVADPVSLAQKMALVFNVHRQRLFDAELKPVLENKDAKPADLLAALGRVRELTILGADATVAALLDAEGLDAKVVASVYDVLAYLSTKASVAKLLERSPHDPKATEALGKCTPAGAEMMFEQIHGEGDTVRLDVYHAVAKICKISSLKADPWWAKANTTLRNKELERVGKIVADDAKRWKALNEDYR